VSACFLVSWTTRATSSTSSAFVITPALDSPSVSSRSLWSNVSSSPPIHEFREPSTENLLDRAVSAVSVDQVHDSGTLPARPDSGRLALHVGEFPCDLHGIIDRSEIVDELEAQSLFSREDAAIGDA